MDSLRKDAARLRLIARISMISAVLSVFLVIGSILLLWYVAMGIFIAVAIHGFYFTPLYYRKHEDLFRTELLLSAMQEGTEDIQTLAERAFVSPEYAEKLIERAKTKGYI